MNSDVQYVIVTLENIQSIVDNVIDAVSFSIITATGLITALADQIILVFSS